MPEEKKDEPQAETKPVSVEPALDAKPFVDEYNALCDKYQMMISFNPVFKLRDDNTYSVVVEATVVQTPKK